MKTIAVIFGGESVEHDVSILTAIQFMNAMDRDVYKTLPVYISPKGAWWTGDQLKDRKFYPLNPEKEKNLTRVLLPEQSLRGEQPYFQVPGKGVFGKTKTLPFDLVLPAIHGTNGEDGSLQGLLDFLGIPYGGCSILAASSTMNKPFTKAVVANLGVPVLPQVLLKKNAEGKAPSQKEVEAALKVNFGKSPFPVFVKPCHLGSSVGATPAKNLDDLMAALLLGFRLDYEVMIEPLVDNLIEYNVAVSKAFGETTASVIESPLKDSEFLDFKAKYLAGDEEGSKLKTVSSEGMVSQNRAIDPDTLNKTQKKNVQTWATTAFDALGLAGSVRIDFLSDSKSGKIWLNEINTVPGSFAYYLWQESEPSRSFTELTTALIEEGLNRADLQASEIDTTLGGSVIFKDK